MQKNEKPLLILSGPTGAGKTDFVLKLCTQLSAEIVNIDVGQFYTPLSIGTAKPNWKDQSTQHHLFDIIDKPENITVVQYRNIVSEKLAQIWQNNKVPILVGGSGFYISSLFFPPQELSSINNNFNVINENSWEILSKIDPERANKIQKNDTYRINRALDIWYKTGKKPSGQTPIFSPINNNIKLIFLTRDREDLYKRIDQRVVQMIEEGWVKEVQRIQHTPSWAEFLKVKKIIGYNDILNYLDSSEQNLDNLISLIQKKVRNYAKRQLTFFKMLEKKINQEKNQDLNISVEWINLTCSNNDLYIKQILKLYS